MLVPTASNFRKLDNLQFRITKNVKDLQENTYGLFSKELPNLLLKTIDSVTHKFL